MTNTPSNKSLIILSGPSCAGKTPLLHALRKNHPEIVFGTLVLYTSRSPRPGEKEGDDFHFRPEAEIRALLTKRFIIGPVRHLWQAVDLDEVHEVFQNNNLIIVEMYPTLAALFQNHPQVKKLTQHYRVKTVFLSPLTDQEIESLQRFMGFASPEEAVAAVMAPKLISRSLQQGKLITPTEMEDIRVRVSKAYEEMQIGKSYSHFLVNHDNEDSIHWKFTPPIGEAGETLKKLVRILQDE
jgi:guanylate kinase